MDSPNSSNSDSPYGPTDVFQDVLVFNVDSWPHKDIKVIDFGNGNIERLINWFEPALQMAGRQVDDILAQWRSMIMFNSQFHDKDSSSLLKMFLSKDPYKSDLKDILHLVEILLLLPISGPRFQHLVSSQNTIKSSLRASLKTSSLEGLTRISAQGPSLEEFHPVRSVNCWFVRDCSKGQCFTIERSTFMQTANGKNQTFAICLSALCYSIPQGQHKNISSSTKICIPVQHYIFQYKKIFIPEQKRIPVQQYKSQYKNMYSRTERCIFQYRPIFLYWYRIISSSTEIYIQVRKYVFQYKNMF